MNAAISILMASLFLYAGSAAAQTAENDKEIAIVELGAAASQSLKGGGSSFGPNLAAEITPIDNWLEIEGGVTPLFSHPLDRMGCRPALQKAVDALQKSGVHGRSGPGVGPYQAVRSNKELGRR